MIGKFSLKEFFDRFPDNDACLEEIKNIRYPEGIFCPVCNKVTKFYKVKNRTAYACEFGGTTFYPLAGTIFEKTTTPLQYWLYAMYSMTKTRSGISAKQLQRELGVTYKTAWRMFKQIRMLMSDNSGNPLDGRVEVDETFVGGKAKNRKNIWTQGVEEKQKQVLMGMVEREGKVYIKHIPNIGKWTLLKQIQENITPKARIFTDEWRGYIQLSYKGYEHNSVNHGAGEYVRREVHTQNIENVWSHLKRGIFGVYRIVSAKYLQAYADEYAFRYNHRKLNGELMFNALLHQVATVKVLKV
jgi:transposase